MNGSLEESRTQALLMKSFAYNSKEELVEDTEKKESDTGEDHEESKAESENEHYGNTGCRVYKWGIQN